MFGETAVGNQSVIAPIIVSGEPVIENGAGKHVPRYRYEIDLDAMTWGDNMLHVEFQLLIDIAEGIDEEGATTNPDPNDSPEVAEQKRQQRKRAQARRQT